MATRVVLEPAKLQTAIRQVEARIGARFPGSGLSGLAASLAAFVVTLEVRAKRRKALEALHELRVLAHVIDLHQIAKDPERSFGSDGAAAPGLDAAAQLSRYLNECSDLLALIGKVAAFYVQGFQDGVVLTAVNDIEELTNGLSRKVWQKLTLLDQMVGPNRA